jgi:hypothetical protein
LKKLSISPGSKKLGSKKAPVIDSWEEDADSGSETEAPLAQTESIDYPDAPPPTPISPHSPLSSAGNDRFGSINSMNLNPYTNNFGGSESSSSARSERGSDGRRPEKTDAVAKRMIAGALGVRAPKKTEEQRAYDKALKEKEIKRRNAEKEAKIRAEEEATRARAAAWED